MLGTRESEVSEGETETKQSECNVHGLQRARIVKTPKDGAKSTGHDLEEDEADSRQCGQVGESVQGLIRPLSYAGQIRPEEGKGNRDHAAHQ